MEYKEIVNRIQKDEITPSLVQMLKCMVKENDMHYHVLKDGTLITLTDKIAKDSTELDQEICSLIKCVLRPTQRSRDDVFCFLCMNNSFISKILHMYTSPHLSKLVGPLIREANKNEDLNNIIFNSKIFYIIADLLENEDFIVALDGYITLKEMIVRYKKNAKQYLLNNPKIFDRYNLLLEGSYLTKRLVFQFYEAIFLDKFFFEIMNRYVDNEMYFKFMVEFIDDSSNRIRMDAFHILKIFIGNPKKTEIIIKNVKSCSKKLKDFINSLNINNETFTQERKYLVDEITRVSG